MININCCRAHVGHIQQLQMIDSEFAISIDLLLQEYENELLHS